MNDQATQSPIRSEEELASTYLRQLQALAVEIAQAMEWIAANALTRFQESVARQELCCAILTATRKKLLEDISSPGEPLLIVKDHSIAAKIEGASEAIRQLNLQYAALLRHSGRSIHLLASLCRSHTGQFQEARGPRLKRQTWSCEM